VIAGRTGLAVALVEIVIGILAGNLFDVKTTTWIDFLAGFGSGLLTFLAGRDRPFVIRNHWKQTLSIGFFSFLLPFIGSMIFARWVVGWDMRAAEIAGIALSTTSWPSSTQ